MSKVRARSSSSLETSSSYSERYITSRSRSVSASRSQTKYDSDTHHSNSIRSGICKVSDYYTKVLGPGVDETILAGLQLLVDNGFLLPNCTEPLSTYQITPPESLLDTASQTESLETKSETSQTTSNEEPPLGESKEVYSIDYPDSSTESTDTPNPASLSSESQMLPSDDLNTEPSQTVTEISSEPVVEAVVENIEPKVSPQSSSNESMELFKKEEVWDVVVKPKPIPEKEQEKEIVPEIVPERVPEIVPEKVLEIVQEEVPETVPEQVPEKVPVEVPENEPPKESEKEPENIEETIVESDLPESSSETNEVEEFTTEDESKADDILRLTEVVRNRSLKSQHDPNASEISTYISKLPGTLIVAAPTFVQNDRPLLEPQENSRSRSTINSSQISAKHSENLKMFDSDLKTSIESKASRRSRRESIDSDESLQEPSKRSSHRSSNDARKKNKETESYRSRRDSNNSRRGSNDSDGKSYSSKRSHRNSDEQKREKRGSNDPRRSSNDSRRGSKDSRRGSHESREVSNHADHKRHKSDSKSSSKGYELDSKESKKSRDTDSGKELTKSYDSVKVATEKSSETSRKSRERDSLASKTSSKHKQKQDTIEEVTENDATEDTDHSLATETMDSTSRSSSVYSGYDTSDEKSSIRIQKNISKADKSSSTASILKSSTSSKSKESSTDSYTCTCYIHAAGESESQNIKNKVKCICPCSYCPRCYTTKTPVVPCPFMTPEVKTEVLDNNEMTCPCVNLINNAIKNQNQNFRSYGSRSGDSKLLCDCYTSTSSTGYTSSSDSSGYMQHGDCGHTAKNNVRYAITKITEYGKFTTYEVMKSTKKVPKFIPKTLEGVFVLKHKS